VFIAINFNGSINTIEENWEKPTFFIQDGGYLFTNSMSGAARLPALMSKSNKMLQMFTLPEIGFVVEEPIGYRDSI